MRGRTIRCAICTTARAFRLRRFEPTANETASRSAHQMRARMVIIAATLAAVVLAVCVSVDDSPLNGKLLSDRRTTMILGAIALIAVVWAVIAVVAWRTRAMRLRRDAGQCIGCGYDLRASKERCPECGIRFTPTHVGRQ